MDGNQEQGHTLNAGPIDTNVEESIGDRPGRYADPARHGRAYLPGEKREKERRFERDGLVLFRVKQLHGLHGVIVDYSGDGMYLVRGNEEGIVGQLFQFPESDLVETTPEQLKTHHSTRLPWNYKS